MAEIIKLPCFVVDVPMECTREWWQRYKDYRQEMKAVLDQCGEGKDDLSNEVIEKYKKGLRNSRRARGNYNIFNDALVIDNITYDYAQQRREAGKCGLTWKVAGTALCRFYSFRQDEKTITCAPFVLKEIFS